MRPDILNSGTPVTEADIASVLGFSVPELWSAARLAKLRGYHLFELNIGGKRRVISRPNRSLKALQRGLYEKVLLQFPVSDRVFSHRGHDVVENAQQHLDRSHMVVLDIENCFPSTTHTRVRMALLRNGLDDRAVHLLTQLVTAKGVLPLGPPTSPGILNLVFAPTDDRLSAIAANFGAVYTRYMDDLCFSADRPLDLLARQAERAIRESGYTINPGKRRVWGPGDRHTVTKIVVSSSLNPNPDYLDALVNELSKFDHGRSGLTMDELRGRIEWVRRLNPDLGTDLIARLRSRTEAVRGCPRSANGMSVAPVRNGQAPLLAC